MTRRMGTTTDRAIPQRVDPPPRSGRGIDAFVRSLCCFFGHPTGSAVVARPRATCHREGTHPACRRAGPAADPIDRGGLHADGSLEVLPGAFPAGWYTGAPTPGELEPAIIAGHVDRGGKPDVFFDLRGLSSGEEMAIIRADGSTARFGVTRIEWSAKDAFPTDAVYGDLDHAGLRSITCGGAFDRQARSYQDNLVVFAELVDREHPSN